jgi:hypothetical protein
MIKKKNIITGFITIATLSSYIISVSGVIVNADDVSQPTAVQADLTTSEITEVKEQRQETVNEIISKLNEGQNVDTAVQQSAKESELNASDSPINEVLKEEMNNKDITSNESISINTNIPDQTFKVSDEITVTFQDNIIGVEQSNSNEQGEITEDSAAISPLASAVSLLDNLFFEKVEAATYKTKAISYSYTWYASTGLKIATLSVAGQGKYNGSSADYYDGFKYNYTNGALSLRSVDNWSGERYRYGTGYTFEAYGNWVIRVGVQGFGITLQTVTLGVYTHLRKDGSVLNGSYKY